MKKHPTARRAKKKIDPDTRNYLIAVRFNKAELEAFKEVAKHPSTKLRDLACAYAGMK